MRALAVTTPGVTKVIDLPTPEINDYECLVRDDTADFGNLS